MRRRLATAVLVTVALVGCGDDGGEDAADPDVPPSTVLPDLGGSSPFAVGAPPEVFDLAVAGVGAQGQSWGDDSTDTDQPITVLAPDGDVTAVIVVVSVAGYLGSQGGLTQAARASNDDDLQELFVDDQEARFLPAGDRTQIAATTWATLTVARGTEEDDLAVQVTSPDATFDELVAIERRVVPAGRDRGPVVLDPPGDLEVVGSAAADATLVTAWSRGGAEPEHPPGSPRDHVAGWETGGSAVTVATVPGAALDPEALPGLLVKRSDTVATRRVEVDGRPGVVVEGSTRFGTEISERWLAVPTSWGDTLVVTASVDDDAVAPPAGALLTDDELVAVAASVTQADDAAWDAFVATVPA